MKEAAQATIIHADLGRPNTGCTCFMAIADQTAAFVISILAVNQGNCYAFALIVDASSFHDFSQLFISVFFCMFSFFTAAHRDMETRSSSETLPAVYSHLCPPLKK